jgi:Zn-dependent M28 family amino/carboxypeptidase
MRRWGLKKHSTLFAAIAAAAALFAGALVPGASAATTTDSSALRNAVTTNGVMSHERALQQIANQNDGTRVSGTSGYDASASYVANKLRGAGYNVTIQPFDFAFFSETAPPELDRVSPSPKTYVEGTDFFTMDYSGSGDVTGTVVPTNDIVIPPGATASTSNSGCETGDFPTAPTGPSVALIQRGTCDFVVKARNAQAAGYDAAIIFNEGQPGRTDALAGTLGGPEVTIPVIGTTFALGEETYNLIKSGQAVTMHVFTSTVSETRSTSNVLADTRAGRTDRTVVVGAHLDSVPEGPGINDNGSGTSTILEIALQMAKLKIQPTNRVRFAFWGAEESGLIGSEHYVAGLSKQQLNDIELNLNFDMVGSPNYVRFVYDGDGSDTPVKGPSGSDDIEDVFVDYFTSRGLATDPTAFDGRSDYGPFIAEGIPAGGLFTGAEGIKTAQQAAVYGGTAGVAYDVCYHQACDTIKNVNTKAIDEMSDATAHTVLTFAMNTSAVNSVDGDGKTLARKGPHLRK